MACSRSGLRYGGIAWRGFGGGKDALFDFCCFASCVIRESLASPPALSCLLRGFAQLWAPLTSSLDRIITMSPTALQLWLSARPVRSITHAHAAMHGPDDSTDVTFSLRDGNHYTTEHHRLAHPLVRGGQQKSQSGPPMHIHLTQKEYFKVVQGKLGTICEGKVAVLGKEDDEFEVLPGFAHRFWAEDNPEGEDLIFDVRVSEPDSGGYAFIPPYPLTPAD